MFKVNNRNTRKRCKICSKLTIKTPERHHWRRSGVFIVNFQHISDLFIVFLLFTLNQVNISWVHALQWSLLYVFKKIFSNKRLFSVANHLKWHFPPFPFCWALHLFRVNNFKAAIHRWSEEWLFFRISGKLPGKDLGWNPLFIN